MALYLLVHLINISLFALYLLVYLINISLFTSGKSAKQNSKIDKTTTNMIFNGCNVSEIVLFVIAEAAIGRGRPLCWSLFLVKSQTFATLLKLDFNTGVFLWILRTFQEHHV